MFTNECLGERITYEATTAAIFMGGMFLTFLVEYITHRIADQMMANRTTSSNKADARPPLDSAAAPIVGKADSSSSCYPTRSSGESVSTAPERQHEVIGVMVLEAGIIFHSISKFSISLSPQSRQITYTNAKTQSSESPQS